MVLIFTGFFIVQVALIGQIHIVNLSRKLQRFLGTAGRDIAEHFLTIFVFQMPDIISEVLVSPFVFKG